MSILSVPWAEIASPLDLAGDAIARLDERLAKSPIREGFVARSHFRDAVAAIWLTGGVVHLHDLVLHDAGADVATPTHDLVRAQEVLSLRRRIAAAEPGSALLGNGLARLRNDAGQEPAQGDDGAGQGNEIRRLNGPIADEAPPDDALDGAFAALDAAMARTDPTPAGMHGDADGLAGPRAMGSMMNSERSALVYDLDRNGEEALEEWRAFVGETQGLPPALAAAFAADAWRRMDPLQRQPWLGRLLAADLLRQRGRARFHLPNLHEGMRVIPFERRRLAGVISQRSAGDLAQRLRIELEAIAAAAEAGRKEHDRLFLQRAVLLRRIGKRSSNSRLPALIDLVMARPVVSAKVIARELQITPRGALGLVADLGLREATGRGSWRAWGVF